MDEELSRLTDEELAALVQRNNNAAFGVLMDRYQEKLLRYGRRFLSQVDHVEDIVQDIFIKTYENIKSFDATRKFSPWIYRVAHNTFLNTIRDRRREPLRYLDLDALVAHPAYEYDPAGEEERKKMQALINTGLASLTPQYREIIVLYYLEGLRYQEIADVLQVPVGTVGVRLRRSREALKKHISQNKKE